METRRLLSVNVTSYSQLKLPVESYWEPSISPAVFGSNARSPVLAREGCDKLHVLLYEPELQICTFKRRVWPKKLCVKHWRLSFPSFLLPVLVLAVSLGRIFVLALALNPTAAYFCELMLALLSVA